MDVKLGQVEDHYYCPYCHSEEVLTTSSHAQDQWDDRSRKPETFPIVAWQDSIRIPQPHGMEAQEMKYHHPSRQALLRKRTTIVTTVTVPIGKYQLKKAVIQELIKHDADSSKIAELVNESDINREGFEQIAQETGRGDRGNGSASTASARTDTPGRQRTQ
jgi:hypothetical protein